MAISSAIEADGLPSTRDRSRILFTVVKIVSILARAFSLSGLVKIGQDWGLQLAPYIINAQ